MKYIGVEKNPSTGKYEVETNVEPASGMTFYGWGRGDLQGWTLSETPAVGDTFYLKGYNADSIRTDPSYLGTVVTVSGDSIIYEEDESEETVTRLPGADVTFPITPAP